MIDCRVAILKIFASKKEYTFTDYCQFRLFVRSILSIVSILYVQIPLGHVANVEPNLIFKQKFGAKMILFCGEALIDIIPLQHEPAFKLLARGVVFNTAIGIG